MMEPLDPDKFLYNYRAEVIDMYDADTVTLRIDLGLHIHVVEKCRLARINAPELRKEERPAGLKARDWLREQIEGKTVFVSTEKDRAGKYAHVSPLDI